MPPGNVYDMWNLGRYRATYNYCGPYPYVPNIPTNQSTFQQVSFQQQGSPSSTHPAYHEALVFQFPRYQHVPSESIYIGQNVHGNPMPPYVHNIEATGHLRIVPESTSQTMPAANYTIVDGSISTSLGSQFTGQLGRKHLAPAITEQPSPRGPPRKPKQSGHALWVGNLPSRASIVDLKDHFSRDATEEIESVFLISNSNCAFVNYKTEIACVSALARFHDSRFQGVRLVCRLRRTGSGDGHKTLSPLSGAPQEHITGEADADMDLDNNKDQARELSTTTVPERFFIVKSLTIEDIERSRVSGVWATQKHNEATLNHAYEVGDPDLPKPDLVQHSSKAVYLIFSANKSGEYFGYARMVSPIPPGDTNPPQDMQESNMVMSSESPITIATPATEAAPAGVIFEDRARGTIFWESDRDENTETADTDKGAGTEVDDKPIDQPFGRPFSVEWLSWQRLPFHRTRGLRNPWNANKEVKIARDGTELEPTVGRSLIELFSLTPQTVMGYR
ncbi:hypothetical protein FQN52_006450 [Onygenales sp. PD_12]|nr:hypothetical protein FQN52_006450 [Onygenales sp. PD_12]KAK2796877.1 hypothetical protein FQN51_008967 [Onygenales sp. PD_10]